MIGQPGGWVELPKHIARDTTLSPIELSVLVNLVARMGDDDGACVACLDSIADEVGAPTLKVSRAIHVLADRGLLRVTQRAGECQTFARAVAWWPTPARVSP